MSSANPTESRSTIGLASDLLALAGLAFSFGTVAFRWASLPEIIPTHFGLAGQPDDWSNKKWLWLLPTISLLLYLGLTWIRRFPHKFNYLWPITESNAPRQYYLAQALIAIMKVEIAWLFTFITYQTVRIGLGETPALGIAFLPVVMVILGGTVVGYLYLAARAA
jgi:hypothetical protein